MEASVRYIQRSVMCWQNTYNAKFILEVWQYLFNSVHVCCLLQVPAQPAKYATSMVKLALVDLSASKEQHQEASSIR